MPTLAPMISPGIRINLVDESNYTALPGVPSNAFCIIGAAQFGPVNVPTLITSDKQFIQTFSTPVDIAGLTAINIAAVGGTVYYCRFADMNKAKKKSVTLTGTGVEDGSTSSLKITANYTGTILEGTWNAIVTKGSTDSQFKLEITRTVGTADPITVVAETELSLNKDDENYYTNWNNDFFTIESGDENDPKSMTANTVEFEENGHNGFVEKLEDNATAISDVVEILKDRESYEFMYVSSPDYSTAATVATSLQGLATSRKDCVVQIDHNYKSIKDDGSKMTAEDIVTDLKSYATTPYVGLWAGLDGFIKDPYNNNAEISVPVSAYLLPALAATYSNNPVWTAPAGVNRLNLSLLTRLDKHWTQEDRDKLYAANINPVVNYKGLGYTVMGQKSGQIKKSAMDRLNVVQLVNYIKVGVEKISIDFLFSPIDDQTFDAWIKRVSDFLVGIKTRRGLYDFKVKMDWETVTPDAINNNIMPGIVKIKPTKVAEFIDIDLIVKNYSDTL